METPNMNVSPETAKPTDNAPAVATPEPTIGNPEKMLEAIKAKVREAANPPKEPEKKPEDKPEETDLKVPPKVLKQLGKLQTELRAAEAKIKDFDSLKTDAELSREVKKLWNGTQDEKLKALAAISGKDGLDTLAELVKFYYEQDQENADGGKPTEAGANKELLSVIADLKKEVADLKSGRETEKNNATKTEADAAIKRANDYVKGFIDRNKSKFELCSRPDNVAEATELAQDAALKIVEREKLDFKTMDQAQAEKIYLEALGEVEAEYEAIGKRFSKTKTEERPAFSADKYKEFVRPLSKPTIVVGNKEELSRNPKERFEQIRQRAIEKAEAGLYRR